MKKKLGVRVALYPMPVTLVGATVDGKPNYATVAHVGIMDLTTVSLGMNKVHYTNKGIKESGTFSINIPSESQIVETDYCGLVSGSKRNKEHLFETFYGQLETAPMITECPLNIECRLVQTIDMPRHDIFIGEVVEVYCSDECLRDSAIDFSKMQPVLFAMSDPGHFTASSNYFKLGPSFAQPWGIGKKLMG